MSSSCDFACNILLKREDDFTIVACALSVPISINWLRHLTLLHRMVHAVLAVLFEDMVLYDSADGHGLLGTEAITA